MATNKSGIFSLGDVGERQSTESWDTFGDVWLVNKLVPVANSSVGYAAGGSNYNATPSIGAAMTSVRRVDYSNDLSLNRDCLFNKNADIFEFLRIFFSRTAIP